MSRLWQSGFELNSTTASVEFTTVTNGTIQTSTVRSGTYAGQVTSLASGVARGFLYQFAAAAGSGPYFVRFYFRYATAPSAANTIFSFDDDTTVGEASACAIKLTSGGALQLFNGASQVGSDSSALSADTWYRVEIEYDGSPAGGSEVLRARLDGTEFAGANNLTLAATVHSISLGGNLRTEAQTTGNWFFDDVAINNNTGSFQTSYPGEGSIVHLRPNAAGDNTAWVGGPHTDSYADVDEVTPDDATSYIASADNTTQISDFNLDATPAAIGSGSVISLVAVGVRFAGETGDTDDTDFALRIKASSGGTVEELVDIDVRSTTWTTNNRIAPRNYPLVLYDLPGASTTAWTKADLDTAQIGVRANQNAGFGQQGRVSTLWLSVEYVAGTLYTSSLSGALSFTGAKIWATNKALSAVVSFTGAISRFASKTLAGVLSFTASGLGFTKSTVRSLTGDLSFTGALDSAKFAVVALTAALSFSGAHSKLTGKLHSATLSYSAALSKVTSRALSGVLAFTGLISKISIVSLASALSFSGDITKRTTHLFSAVCSFTGNTIKDSAHLLSASLTLSGSIVKTTYRSFVGALTTSGSLLAGSLYARSLTAALSFTGNLSKLVGKGLASELSFTGALTKLAYRVMSSTLSFSANVLRSASRLLTASLSLSGSLAKSSGKVLVGGLSFIGSLLTGSAFFRNFTATLTFTGNLATSAFNRILQQISIILRGDKPEVTVKADTNALTIAADDQRQTLEGDASAFTIEGDDNDVTIKNEVT